MTIKSFEIPYYGAQLHIIFSEDIEKDFDLINTTFFKTLTKKKLKFIAQSECKKGHYTIVFNIKNVPKKNFEAEIVNTIAHESIHIYSLLCKNVGMFPDVDNDESQAYFIGWLAGETYKTYLTFKTKQINEKP